MPGSWCVAPMGMLCSLSDGEKQTGVERINLDVKYLRGERDAKTLTAGKFTPANSLLRENKVGSAIPHLNKKLFKEIEVPIPPYKEQQRIVEAIYLAFKYLDTIMESL